MFGILGNLFGSDEEEKVIEKPISAVTDPGTKRTEMVYEDGGAAVTDLNVDEEGGDQAGFTPDPEEQDIKLDTSIGGMADEAATRAFGTSTIKTWNPQSNTVEDTEVPTWWRAGKGLSQGLMSYGINLLRTGDKGQAWAGAIESAFGSLGSEQAAMARGQKWEESLTELVKGGKYTPESIRAYAQSGGDTSRLALKESVLSAKEAADVSAKKLDQLIEVDKLQEQIRSAKVNEAINWTNASTAQFNAETGRYNAEVSIQEVEGKDGNKYIIPYNSRTQERGEPILKDSKAGKELLQKQTDQQSLINTANDTLGLIGDMLADDKGRKAAVGPMDARTLTAGEKASTFEANHKTLTSKMFLDSVKQMKGMGALSDAEGKKLEAAIAGLDLSMNQDAYKAQLKKVQQHYVKLVELVEQEKGGGGNKPQPKQADSKYSSLYK